MSVEIKDWILLVVWVAGAALSLYNAPRYWRHEITVLDGPPPSWWPYGDPLWRGWIRTPVIALVWWITAGLGYVALRLGPDPGWPAPIPILYIVLAAGVPCVLLALVFSVMLFSWPRSLIPPHLRYQPGAVSEWIRALRRRQGSTHGSARP